MKTLKKLGAVLLSLAIILTLIPMETQTAKAGEGETSGSCGDKATWTFQDGTLTISGSGAMTDWDEYTYQPWDDYELSITNLVIDDGITSVGDYAFDWAYNIEEISLPDTLESIGDCAFSHTVISSIKLPDSLKTIGRYSFSNCTFLSKITIPANVTTIGEYAFQDTGLENITFKTSKLKTIPKGLFAYCEKLKKVVIPEGVTKFDFSEDDIFPRSTIFYFCTSLTSITLPASLKSADPYIFMTGECYNYDYQIEESSPDPDYSDKLTIYGPCTNTCVKNLKTALAKEACSVILQHKALKNNAHKCSHCGKTINTFKAASLSFTKATYSGKVKTPAVTVKNTEGDKMKEGTDYALTYASGRKSVGTYTVKVTFKGNYKGTAAKTLKFKINPKGTTLSKLTALQGGFKATWAKQTTQTTGYQLEYSKSSKFTSPKILTISKNTTLSAKATKLTRSKKYYVRVRTYKTVKGTKYYSSWSKYNTVTTK